MVQHEAVTIRPFNGAPSNGVPLLLATEANIRKETKGRAGKIVTIIDGLSIDPEELKSIAKILKKKSPDVTTVSYTHLTLQTNREE